MISDISAAHDSDREHRKVNEHAALRSEDEREAFDKICCTSRYFPGLLTLLTSVLRGFDPGSGVATELGSVVNCSSRDTIMLS